MATNTAPHSSAYLTRIQNLPLFDALADQDRQRLFQSANYHCLSENDTLLLDDQNRIMILADGQLKLCHSDQSLQDIQGPALINFPDWTPYIDERCHWVSDTNSTVIDLPAAWLNQPELQPLQLTPTMPTFEPISYIETELLQNRVHAGLVALFGFVILGAGSLLYQQLLQSLSLFGAPALTVTRLTSWLSSLAVVVPALLLLRCYGTPIQSLPLFGGRQKQALIEGALVAGSAVIGLSLLTGLLQRLPIPFELPQLASLLTFYLTHADYMLQVCLMECFARGVVQSQLSTFLQDRSGWASVVVTAFCFSAFLSQGDGVMALGIFAMHTLLGGMFLRHNNIIGATMAHFSLGMIARFLIG